MNTIPGLLQSTEEIQVKLDGLDMIHMGWTLGEEEAPETDFMLTITTDGKILLTMLASNWEWVSTAHPYDFDLIDTVQDLIRHGYLMVANDNGEESESGTLQIKP